MNRHSLRWGATASGALTGFYVAVVGASGGWEHLVDQAHTDWWLLTIEGLDEPATAQWALPEGT